MTGGGSRVHGRPRKSTLIFAQRGVAPEFSISGSQVLVVLAAGSCLVGSLVWMFVKYWLFAP